MLLLQTHVTKYFAREKNMEFIAAQFNRHGNCATATVDILIAGKFQVACVYKITVKPTIYRYKRRGLWLYYSL